MADLDNLLDDMNNDDGGSFGDDDDDQQQQVDFSDDDNDEYDQHQQRAVIPSALAAAAERRRQLEQQQDEYGAGDEERDYQQQDGGVDDGEGDIEGDVEGGDYDDQNYNEDYEQLKGLWTSELACPELLPSDAETIGIMVEEITKKEEDIEELLTASRQQKQQRNQRGGGQSAGGEISGELASLVAQITKMDMDRTRFMLVDLARTRMAKIENHALHNRTLLDRMTEEETTYLRQYGELLERHYRRTVLNQMPKENWKRLDDPEMIDTPDLERFVFVRVLGETVQIDVTAGDRPNILNEEMMENVEGVENDDEDDDADHVQEHEPGSYLIVMYKAVRDLILEGKVELLM